MLKITLIPPTFWRNPWRILMEFVIELVLSKDLVESVKFDGLNNLIVIQEKHSDTAIEIPMEFVSHIGVPHSFE